MASQYIENNEYKHLECPQSWVNVLLNQYSVFFWNLVATQVVVSKESHLERGGVFDSDSIYSVTTTERFATIDLKRRRDIPYLDTIRDYEQKYMHICGQLVALGCTPLDNYSTPPKDEGTGCTGCLLYSLFIIPGILHAQKVKQNNEERAVRYQQLAGELAGLITSYKQFLSMNGLA
jgi:hypothetical protein